MPEQRRYYEAQARASGRPGLVAEGVKSGHYVYLVTRGQFEVSVAGNQARGPAGSVVWIGAGTPRHIRCSRNSAWTVLRLRNRGMAPGNDTDARAWQSMLRLGQLGRLRPRLPLEKLTVTALGGIAGEMCQLQDVVNIADSLMLKACALRFLATVIQDSKLAAALERHTTDPTQALLIQRALQIIEDDGAQILSVPELAKRSGASRSSLYRAFSEGGLPSPAALLERIRLERAGRLLRESDETVLGIAMDAGFSSLSAFYRAFHRAYGVAPGQWRRGR